MSKVFEKWKVLSLFLALFMVLGVYGTVKANEFAAYSQDYIAQQIATKTETSAVSAIDENGNTYIAYVDSNEVYVQKMSSGGSKMWGVYGVKALTNTMDGNLSNPKIVYIGSGKVAVIARSANNKRFYMQIVGGSNGALFLPSTSPATTGQVLTTNGSDIITTNAATDPYAIAYDGEGVVVAYLTKAGAANSLMVGKFSTTNGGPIYTPVAALTANAGVTITNEIAMSVVGTDTVVAAAYDDDNNDSTGDNGASVYANKVSSVGAVSRAATSGILMLQSTTGGGDAYINLKLVSDGASGLVLIAQNDLAGGTSAIEANRLKAADIAGSTTDLSANARSVDNGNEVVAGVAGQNLLSAAFEEAGSTDYVAFVYSNGTTTVLQKCSLATTVNLDTKYATAAAFPSTATILTNAKLLVQSAKNFVIIGSYANNASPLAYYVTEAAAGTSATLTWQKQDLDNDNAATGTLNNAFTVSGYTYVVYMDGGTEAGLTKFHHVPGYDLTYTGGTDLTDVSPSPFEVGITGGTVQVKDRVLNVGDQSSPATTISYFLTNATTMAMATKTYLLGTRDVPAIEAGGGESADVTTDLTIPAASEHGVTGPNRYIIGVINYENVSDEVVGGNTVAANSSTALGITINQPNLRSRASAMTVSPASNLKPGDTVTVTDTIENNGSYAAGEFKVNYYLVDNNNYTGANLSANGILLGSRTISSLGAGETSHASTSLTLPSSWTKKGVTLRIQALVDADNQVSESDETDNAGATAYGNPVAGQHYALITVSLPNLGGVSPGPVNDSTIAVAGGTYQPGDTVNFNYSVHNDTTDAGGNVMGNSAATDVAVKFYFGPAALTSIANIKAQCQEVGTAVNIPSIASGGTYSSSGSFVVPATGGTTLYMVMDPDNAIQEGDETDNIVTDAVPMLGLPDLKPSGVVVAPTKANQGEDVKISFSVQNLSATPADPSSAGIYLSTDTTWDSSDTLVGLAAVPDIAPNGSETLSGDTAVTATIPSSLADGTYYVIVKVNYDGALSELSTENNTAASALALTVGEVVTYPTLDLRIDPIAGTPGVAFHFTDNVYDANGAAHISANTIQTGTEAVDLYVKCTYPDGQSAWLYFDADGLVRFHDEPAPEWSNVTFDETTDYALIHSAWWFDNSKKAEWNLPIGTYTWEITVVKAGGSIDVPEDIVQTDSATLTLE